MAIIRIAVLLVDGFTLLSTSSVLEPLRAANMFSTQALYEISLLRTHPDSAGTGMGASFASRHFADVAPDFDLILVVAGGGKKTVRDPVLFRWLRRADHAGVAMGGISGGSLILAKAGLLDGYRFTVHWHHYEAFATMPGSWLLERRLFVIDRTRYTCAGGSAPLDMMYAIIARDHGTRFARRISDWFIQTEIRPTDTPQKPSTASRYGTLPKPVSAALELMETHIADPLDQQQIAGLVGVSERHLRRLFTEALGIGMMDQYRRMRLETSRELVRTTRLSLGEVAQMVGFGSQSHFTEAYRALFNEPPSIDRRASVPAA
ncbi:GlxA family transcriptional regulator [Ponticoccus sp. (in: a-proteobacteria)]|uniref:GlxA family transcriptional regulator n=1 Tax=Ponticoccus sp. (in: a-proteobacteria) TaxID=1925025 RepID=UPI003AB8D47A